MSPPPVACHAPEPCERARRRVLRRSRAAWPRPLRRQAELSRRVLPWSRAAWPHPPRRLVEPSRAPPSPPTGMRRAAVPSAPRAAESSRGRALLAGKRRAPPRPPAAARRAATPSAPASRAEPRAAAPSSPRAAESSAPASRLAPCASHAASLRYHGRPDSCMASATWIESLERS
ncbi:hypothetical protein BS78_K318800 [Paspalum vaginatum]|uniref:Uncharacterized protein n=1 Tax=Paspalum vaginatum TaxID=158149 RepID=A0A9W8CGD0_9POAL|nr:hypothetical protein BS78_K318800 [Paspalum vaginatum]